MLEQIAELEMEHATSALSALIHYLEVSGSFFSLVCVLFIFPYY